MIKSRLLSILFFIGLFFIFFMAMVYIYRQPIKKIIKKYIPKVVLKKPPTTNGTNIIFLHHSTGQVVWNGGISKWFEDYRKTQNKEYYITEQEFPKEGGNFPFDYWNLWVKNAGPKPVNYDPTLEMITKHYDVIIWKHCYPVIDIKEDTGAPDISSDEKRMENYKLQYEALKRKMHEFPNNKFIVWTGAVRVKAETTEEMAMRGKSFVEWVKKEWDEPNDNIFLWDFYELETEGGIYLKDEYALGVNNSHPNNIFGERAAQLLCQRVIDVIEGRGDTSNLTGDSPS